MTALTASTRGVRSGWRIAVESGLTSSIGLASLCGVYGLAYDVRPGFWSMLSAACLFWMLFLADRLAETEPDSDHAAAFVHGRRRLMLGLLAVAVLGELAACVVHPSRAIAIVGALVCGLLYFTPVPGWGRAVKDLPGAKSFYAATLILAICHLYVWPLQPASGGQLGALAAVLFLEQVSNAVYDMKDVETDRRRGIRTLVTMLERRTFLLLEATVCAMGLAVVLWAWTPASAALGLSFVLHLLALIVLLRRPFDRTMTVGLDLVYSAILLVGVLTAGSVGA